MKILISANLIFLFLLSGCYKNEIIIELNSTNMNKINESEWIKLSGERIFFGHQSVGYNLMEGITELKSDNKIDSLVIMETIDIKDFNKPVFAHALVGRNMDPKSKIDGFVKILNSGLADSLDIAFLKLCYVDINRHTDLDELFEYYRTSMSALQEKYPDLTLIHFTVPVTTKPEGLKGLAKTILRMNNNKERNRYNELLRKNYNESELFDIAKFESTYTDGSLNTYRNGIPCLISEYSSDDGHLNQFGRKLIAMEFIKKLGINIDLKE